MGWAGNVLIVIGLWLVGNKCRHAFLFSIAGELFWTAHAIRQGLWDLAAICIVFCVLALRNWWKWGEK